MKNLLIITHAKAEQYISGQDDHDRNLNQKGKKRALKLSMWLRDIEPKIEKIFCSSALRTSQTAEIINEGFLNQIPVKIESGLYGASEEELLNFLLFIDDDISSVGLVGHEPGLKQLAIYLALALLTEIWVIAEATLEKQHLQ